MTSQTINLNLIPGGVEPVIHVSQYDKGQTWTFNIYSGSQSFSIPSGANVSIRGTKPDNNGFAYDCTYSGNAVTATEQQQMTAVAGKVAAEIVITKNSEMIGSANFVINVEKAALDSDTPISDTEIPAIIELAQEQAEDAEAWAKGTKNGQAVPSTAEQYHNNAKYWAEQASGSAADALKSEGYAVGKQNGTDVASGSPYYHNNSKYYSEQAASSASTASTKASQASTSATNAANSATSASGSATTATQKATAAANSATAAANSATAAQQAAASLTVDSALSSTSTNPVQNKIVKGEFDSVKQALSNEVSARATLGAHNLLPQNAKSQSGSGVTYTVNADGTVSVSGTATAVTQLSNEFVADADYTNVVLTGIPAANLNMYMSLLDQTTNTEVALDTGNGSGTFNLVKGHRYNNRLIAGATFSSQTARVVSPMLRLATDSDTTYRPYVPTNSQLLSYKDNGVLGAKNFLTDILIDDVKAKNTDGSWSSNVYTLNNVKFTLTVDSSNRVTKVVAEPLGTRTGETLFYLRTSASPRIYLPKGSYKVNGYDSSYHCTHMLVRTSSDTAKYDITYNDTVFDVDGTDFIKALYINIPAGATYTATIQNLMILLATDTDPTYQPYAMTNKELTDVAEQEIGNYMYKGSYNVSVTADGVKDRETLMHETSTAMLTALQNLADDEVAFVSQVSINSGTCPIITGAGVELKNTATSFSVDFSRITITLGTGSEIIWGRYHSTKSGVRCALQTLSTSSGVGATTDLRSDVPTSGNKFTIYYRVYKKIS